MLMHMALRNILIFLIIIFPVSQTAEARSELTQPVHKLFIQTPSEKHIFLIEIADTPQKWERGLMYRKALKENQGMLFVFPRVDIAQFWMKNTLIPLDMLFIDSGGKIIKIQRKATPESLAIISSGAPVKAVLEIAGGASDKLKLQTGDRVIYADTFKAN